MSDYLHRRSDIVMKKIKVLLSKKIWFLNVCCCYLILNKNTVPSSQTPVFGKNYKIN